MTQIPSSSSDNTRGKDDDSVPRAREQIKKGLTKAVYDVPANILVGLSTGVGGQVAPVVADWIKEKWGIVRAAGRTRVYDTFVGVNSEGEPHFVVVSQVRVGEGLSTSFEYVVSVTDPSGAYHFPLIGTRWIARDDVQFVRERPEWFKRLTAVLSLITHGLALSLLLIRFERATGFVCLTLDSPQARRRFDEIYLPIEDKDEIDRIHARIARLIQLSAPPAAGDPAP